jgi:hypothetical protein
MIAGFRLSRRQMLTGGLALGALGPAAVYVGSADASDFFTAMVRSELPGVKVNDATIRAITADAMKALPRHHVATIRALSKSCRIVDYSSIIAALGHSFKFQHFRREMLTFFLFGTDFFELADPTASELQYVGERTACSNPFARFARD